MLKNILLKKEIKKFTKLVNKKNVMIVSNNNKLSYLYNKETKKVYIPKYQLEII